MCSNFSFPTINWTKSEREANSTRTKLEKKKNTKKAYP